MKKIFISLCFLIFLLSTKSIAGTPGHIHEYTIDLYYANGVLGSARNEEYSNWAKRVEELKESNVSLRRSLKYGGAKLAYNASFLLGIGDFWESIEQFASDNGQPGKITWFLVKRWLIKQGGPIAKMIDLLSKLTTTLTVLEQRKAYMESIKQGHGVITVAHSQGNFFTNQVFEGLPSWMQQYVHMIGVASPSNKVFNGGPHITFDNDMINIIPGNLESTHENPNRERFRNAVNEIVDTLSVVFHGFNYYMGEKVTIEDMGQTKIVSTQSARVDIEKYILEALDKHINADSQWEKIKDIGCLCSQKRIIMGHKYDEELTVLLSETEVYDFEKGGKLYFTLAPSMTKLVYSRSSSKDSDLVYATRIDDVNKGQTCYELLGDINIDTPPILFGIIEGPNNEDSTLPGGLFTASLGWGQTIVAMEMSNGLMPLSKSGCGYAKLSSGDRTLSSVYPGTYPIGVTASNYDKVDNEDLPDTVKLKVKAVYANKADGFVVTDKYQYPNLGSGGHIADIIISRSEPGEDPAIEVIPLSGGGSGGRSWGGSGGSWHWHGGGIGGGGGGNSAIPISRDKPPLCETTDCACLPCQYSILTYLNQTRLGPISGAKVRLYKATQEDNGTREILYEGETTTSNEIDEAGVIYLPVPYPQQPSLSEEEQDFMDAISGYDGDFILEVSGGVDIDSNDDFTVDSNYKPVNGKLHLVLSKERLLQNDYKVNILTEISYQLSRDLLGENYNQARLQERLDDIAKHIFIEKLYPDANQPLGRDDLFYWIPMAHKDWLIKPYDMTLAPIVDKIYNGENIYNDAYEYVYGELDSSMIAIPIVKSQWFKVDENISSGGFIGQIDLISEGNSSIENYTISGDGSSSFRVESDGKIYLKDDATLDYETSPLYQMQLVVSNADGASKPVTVYIIIENILDAPEDKGFTGGIISEDVLSGTIAGELIFNPGASAIERIEIGGEDQFDFTVDFNGTIKVSENANFDYETRNYRKITLQAFNSYGGSRVVPISFIITDAVDVPIVQTLDVHLDENVASGYEVGHMDILSDEPIESVVLEGDGKENFSIDLNGTVRVADGVTLDYESKVNYVFQVVATNSLGMSRPGILIIRVNNVPDVPELKRTELRVVEMSPVGTEVGKVLVETNGSSVIIGYSLSGDGSENFAIDQQGVIRLTNGALSWSDQQFFNLFATASNSEGESLKARVVVYIDTQRPILGILDSYIYENAASETLIGTVPMVSSATPITDIHLEGAGKEKFVIDLQRNVRLANGVILDYEETTHYNLSVVATNSAGQSDVMPLYIRVIDIPDTLKIAGFSTTIYENIPEDTTIGFSTIVNFGGKAIDHYELTGVGSENFIVENDGSILIKSGAQFDSATQPKYHLSLVAVDTDGVKSNEVFVDISVVKSINVVPQINNVTVTLKEDSIVNTSIAQATIVSKTQVVEQAWLEGEGSDVFELKTDGSIMLRKALDFETKNNYVLTMFARNSLGQSQGATLSVNITNVVDDEPALRNASFNITENIPIGTVVGTVPIESEGTSAITSISLSGIDIEKFTIDPNGVIKTAQEIDYESKTVYHLQAVATNDKADSAEVAVDIQVENVPEHVPVLYAFKGFVEDNATAETVVGKVTFAYEGDSPTSAFALSGAGKENFTIDVNGTIRVSTTASFDETIQKTYSLQVSASNESGSSDLVGAIIVLTHDKTIPYRPSNLKILDIGHNSITLGWVDNADNERGFNLYQDGVKVATLSPDVTMYRIAGLEEDTSYLFSLKSFNDRGESTGISIEAITDIDRTEYFKATLKQKCGISDNTFDTYFNSETGYYASSIDCRNRGLTDEDLLDFKALKGVKYQLYLDRNNLTNVDGLSNLKSVGSNLYLYSNQLTNVDGLGALETVGSELRLNENQLTNVNGLSSLKSVGSHLYLNSNDLTNVNGLSSLVSVGGDLSLLDNQITNVDGLSALTTVGSHFYLQRNQLININGLSALSKVGGDFNLEHNQLTNLDSLTNLTTLGGYLALRGNDDLTDISGVQNIIGSYGKLLYINPDQYTQKASVDSNMCSVTWDLRSPDENIADDMSQMCEGQEAYVAEPREELRDALERKCGISVATFYTYFNGDTGYYASSINCASKGLNDEDLLDFKALKGVKYQLYLDRNNLTNVDGLSNLKSVGNNLYLYSNQLTNVDGLEALETVGGELRLNESRLTNVNGLSSLKSVGQDFNLQSNQLTNVNGLSSLKSVGSHLFLNSNNLTNVNGLSSLVSVGNSLNLENNQLTNLDGLINLKSLGGYLALRNNPSLTDISGAANIQSANGRLLYINPNQYTTKVDENASFCSTVWDIRSPDENIADDMSLVCDLNNTQLTDEDKLRNTLGEKCAIDSATFYANFNSDTGYYASSINCSSKGLNDEDLLNFKALKSVHGYFNLYGNQLTNVDGLSNLKSVGSSLYLYSNQLTNVDGLGALETVGGELRLNENQLTNVNGLSSLKSVGSHLYLNSNNLTNVNGLSSLVSVGNSLNLENNQLTNLDGLINLKSFGGYLALRNNPSLTDISGVSNIIGSDGQLLYVAPEQYTVKADDNGSFCSATWDLKDINGNITDDMTLVCASVDPYAPDEIDNLREALSLCAIDSATFYANFNSDTGYYASSINCSSKGLNDEDLLNFKALKSVHGYFNLYGNQLTNVDGLSNLKSVGSSLYLYSNQLTNVDGLGALETVGGELRLNENQLTNVNGLSSLTTVGQDFNLQSNQLTNVNGLSSLKSVGSHLFLNTNNLTNVNGLSSLVSVGNSLNLENNQLTNLDGLVNLTTLGGYLALRNNPSLTDISGVSNIVGSDGQLLYVAPEQYDVKANQELKFCSVVWNLHDSSGDIDDDMTLVCGEGVPLTEAEQLRAVMDKKCSVSFAQFADNFDESTGVYSTSLDCSYRQMNDEDLMKFSIVNEITGSLSLNNNNLTNLDGLSNLTAVGGYFYLHDNNISDISGIINLTSVGGTFDISHNNIADLDGALSLVGIGGSVKIYNNSNLVDVSGLANIVGFDGQKIYIDQTDYSVKVANSTSLCSVVWDLYDTQENISDDMSKLCEGYNYVPTEVDKLRDILGKRCNIDSLTFYNKFADDSGIYNGSIQCYDVTEDELDGFVALLEVNGDLSLNNSSITSLDGFIRIKSVIGNLSIEDNTALIDISGLSNIQGVSGKKLIIDDASQYQIKADSTKPFCSTSWNIYQGAENVTDDLSSVCNQ